MARNRTIPVDFWTWEAVIDCAPMTRLLFIGLWNFADDGGVQPLRPRTIRMQVFPGDDIDNDKVRAMLDELAAQGLIRTFEVEGVQYISIVDWEQIQTVGRRARRRYPRDPAKPVPSEQPAPVAGPSAQDAADAPSLARWREAVEARLRTSWPGDPPEDADSWIDQWIAEGCDLERDVLPAISDACRPESDRDPPTRLRELAALIAENRARRLAGAAQGQSTSYPPVGRIHQSVTIRQ